LLKESHSFANNWEVMVLLPYPSFLTAREKEGTCSIIFLQKGPGAKEKGRD
jgi:hypothetical protein